MQICSIYKGSRKPGAYLYIERRGDFSRLPAELLRMLGSLELVMDLDLGAGKRLVGADIIEVQQQLSHSGYYLQLPPRDYHPQR
ncbi:MAG: YcgL domain-containing protein [Gammaproteobacteria bacterium]|nr:YcgL domain-containing protein [Gammaproteobacteria bacterium]